MHGFIYILSNVSMPQLFKIGMTDRTPDERSVELFTTGVPTPFEIEISIKVQDARYCEKLIFQKLSKYRLANNREFFHKITLAGILKEIFPILGNYHVDYWKSNLDVEQIQNEIQTRSKKAQIAAEQNLIKVSKIKKWVNQNYDQFYKPMILEEIAAKNFREEVEKSEVKRFGEIFKKPRSYSEVYLNFFRKNSNLCKDQTIRHCIAARNAKRFYFEFCDIYRSMFNCEYWEAAENEYFSHNIHYIPGSGSSLATNYSDLHLLFPNSKFTLFEHDFAHSLTSTSLLNLPDALQLLRTSNVFSGLSRQFPFNRSPEYMNKVDISPLI